MKCPNCKNEMEIGSLFNHGYSWRKGKWGGLNKFFLMVSGMTVNAYRCPKCGKVELTTEVK